MTDGHEAMHPLCNAQSRRGAISALMTINNGSGCDNIAPKTGFSGISPGRFVLRNMSPFHESLAAIAATKRPVPSSFLSRVLQLHAIELQRFQRPTQNRVSVPMNAARDREDQRLAPRRRVSRGLFVAFVEASKTHPEGRHFVEGILRQRLPRLDSSGPFASR
ncbi:MAG: hypothetical protein ACK4MF_09045 [Hyphomicrobiaceae bacterium]